MNDLSQLNELYRQLAQQLVETTDADDAAEGWSEVSLDVRFSPESTLHIAKIRAQVGDSLVSLSALSGKMLELIDTLHSSGVLGHRFYGFLITITSDRAVQINLNYDPACYSDPDFIAS